MPRQPMPIKKLGEPFNIKFADSLFGTWFIHEKKNEKNCWHLYICTQFGYKKKVRYFKTDVPFNILTKAHTGACGISVCDDTEFKVMSRVFITGKDNKICRNCLKILRKQLKEKGKEYLLEPRKDTRDRSGEKPWYKE